MLKSSLPEADVLFEQHTIAEIIDLERKLKSDIEKKKEDLRQMVGERYRDLLEAADTITSMKNNATTVIKHMALLRDKCDQISRFEVSKPQNYCAPPSNLEFLTLVHQVKFLVDTPTKIWSCLDNNEYLRAGLIFLAARHTHVSLLLKPEIYTKFPLLKSQWTSINSTLPLIQTACEKFLEYEAADVQATSDALCCLILLNEVPLKSLLVRFLEIRKTSIIQILKSDKPGSTAKNLICRFLALTLNSVSIISSVFCSSSILVAKVKLLQSKNCPELLLPEAPGFTPVVSSELLITYNPSELEQICEEWFKQLSKICQDSIIKLLEFVTTCQSLSSIRQAALELLSKNILSQESEPELKLGTNLWNLFLNSGLIARIKSLINQSIESNFNQLLACVNMTSRQVDMMGLVWEQGTGGSKEHLEMKAAGHPQNIQRICTGLESRLNTLVEDLKYVPSLNDEISSQLKVECELFVNKLTEHLKSKKDPQWQLFVYKLCQSLPELCPTLFHSYFHKLGVSQLLEEAAESAFKAWSKDLIEEMCKKLDYLSQNLTPTNILTNLQTWDKLDIQEEADEGKVLKSTIFVPFQVSQPVHSVLFSLILEINKAGAHCLQRRTIQGVGEELVKELGRIYSHVDWPPSSHLSQTCALQILFDLHFVGQLLGQPIDPNVISQIENKIDPFDLDVFSGPLQNNLRLSTHRSLLLYGLISSPLTSILSRPASSQEIHNLIVLNSEVPSKFSLLPLSIQPSPAVATQTKTKASIIRSHGSSPNLTSLPNSATSPSKSASFYDRMTSVMGSSWFS